MTHPKRTAARLLGAAAAGAVALGVVPATVSAQTPAPTLLPVPIEGFCADAPETSSFADVAGTTFEDAIACLELPQIALGVDGSNYRPANRVTRQQMASLVARTIDTAVSLDGPDEELVPLPAYDSSNAFADVAVGNAHLNAINRLEAVGIVQGGPGGLPGSQFGPGLPMTREQMATTLANALRYISGLPLEAEDDYFVDDDGRVHEPSINLIADLAIGVGNGFDRFDPAGFVNRGQMAAFVSRTLAFLELGGIIDPLPAPTPPADEAPAG